MAKFRIARLEDRIVPSALSCSLDCGSDKSHKSHKCHSHKGNNGFGNGGHDGSPNGKQDRTR